MKKSLMAWFAERGVKDFDKLYDDVKEAVTPIWRACQSKMRIPALRGGEPYDPPTFEYNLESLRKDCREGQNKSRTTQEGWLEAIVAEYKANWEALILNQQPIHVAMNKIDAIMDEMDSQP